MKFYRINEEAVSPSHVGLNRLALFSSTNITIQPGEIKKVKTSITLEPDTEEVVVVFSDLDLATNKAICVFGAPIFLTESMDGELLIPLHNQGRNPLNLLKGDRIANLMVFQTKFILLYDGGKKEVSKDKSLPKTEPQKFKGTDFKFEVR